MRGVRAGMQVVNDSEMLPLKLVYSVGPTCWSICLSIYLYLLTNGSNDFQYLQGGCGNKVLLDIPYLVFQL